MCTLESAALAIRTKISVYDWLSYHYNAKKNESKICKCVKQVERANDDQQELEQVDDSLWKEVEEALRKASLVYDGINTPKKIESSFPTENAAPNKSVKFRDPDLTAKEVQPLHKTKIQMHTQTVIKKHSKVKYFVPAYQKAPYKTELMRPTRTLRNSRKENYMKYMPNSITGSEGEEVGNLTRTFQSVPPPEKCIIPSNNIPFLSNSEDSFTSKEKLRELNCSQYLNLSSIRSIDEENNGLGNSQHSSCPCQISRELETTKLQKSFLAVYRRLCHLILNLLCDSPGSEAQLSLMKHFHKQTFNSYPQLSMRWLVNKFNEVEMFSKYFLEMINNLDLERQDPITRQWICSTLSYLVQIVNKLNIAYTTMRDNSTIPPKNVIDNPSSQADLVHDWLSNFKSEKRQISRLKSSFDVFDIYAVIGQSPDGSRMPSRSAAFNLCPQLLTFTGTRSQIKHYLDLWSQLEQEQLRLSLLKSISDRLPNLIADVGLPPKTNASMYRVLYGLITGASPVALRTN